MKNYFSLRVLDLFKSIYTKFGIDYNIMRLIIQVKLTLDSRRVSNMANNGMEEQGKDKNYFYSSLLIYAILGLMSIPILFMNVDVRLKMTMYFSYIMILLLTILISDFSSVILDTNDKDIIGIRGVEPKTLNAAKTTHIFMYIFMLTISLAGGGLVVSIKFGIRFFLMMLLSLILIDILMIIITAIMYFIILQFFKGEKLKDMLNTFQIAFLLLFTVGYQFAIQSTNFIDVEATYVSSWFNILYIPMWFASNFKLLEGSNMDIISIVLSSLSIVVPILSLVMYEKFVPLFEKNLQKLNDNSDKEKIKKDSFTYKLSKFICKDKEERVIFNFVHNILSKDREFKTKVYPSLALGIFMPIIMLVISYENNGIRNYIIELRSTTLFFTAYFSVVVIQNVIAMLKHSNEYEACWIYDVLPIKNKKNIYSGMFKASLYKLYAPSFLVMSIIFIGIFGLNVLKHLIITFLVGILVSMGTFAFSEKALPFSEPYNITDTSKNLIVVLKSLIITLVLGGAHFVITISNQNILYVYIIVLLIIIRGLWNKVFNVKS